MSEFTESREHSNNSFSPALLAHNIMCVLVLPPDEGRGSKGQICKLYSLKISYLPNLTNRVYSGAVSSGYYALCD